MSTKTLVNLGTIFYSSTLSSDEYGQPVVTEHIEQQLVLNNMSMRYQRSQSVDELSQKNIGRKASVKISRKIT